MRKRRQKSVEKYGRELVARKLKQGTCEVEDCDRVRTRHAPGSHS